MMKTGSLRCNFWHLQVSAFLLVNRFLLRNVDMGAEHVLHRSIEFDCIKTGLNAI